MADFDAIVVGAGCAGAAAAFELAKAGKSVLMIERGNQAGAKNMTGGRLYSHALKSLHPDFESEAPLERKITHEKISLLSSDSNFTIDYSSDSMRNAGEDSYSVLRAEFDPWLASKAEDAGAEAIYGIAVESLMKDETGKICGVKAGEDEISSDLVILADGVNSLLTKEAVGFEKPTADKLAVGIKQVIELDEKTVSDRCNTTNNEGIAWLFAGNSTHGHIGGGFLYTNKTSISLGLVATISDLYSSQIPIYQMLEDFKKHPAVAPLIAGGTVVEHSGHMVPEGGLNMMPPLVGDGVILAGESAMMCINLGYMVRGMDYSMTAGMFAGREGAKALDNNDTSKAGLQGYIDALENSYVLKDLKQFSKFPHFMESTKRIFNEYPVMIKEIMDGMFIVNGSPTKPLKTSVIPPLKKVGILNLLKDVRGGMKAL